METSAACVCRPQMSILFSPFSDQTHLDFYRHRSTSLPSPCLSLNLSPSRSLSFTSSSKASLPPLRALCENAFASPSPAFEKDSLMMELAELKLQMKQKKKELKSQKKDEKRRLKLQAKEEKAKMMQTDLCTEGKKKKTKKCYSESSSESSDEDCHAISMRMLRQESAPERALVEDIASEGSCDSSSSASLTEAMSVTSAYSKSPSSELYREVTSTSEREGVRKRSTFSLSSSAQCFGSSSPFAQAPNRIEVCAGGKCKKAGSEKLLAELGAQLPSSSNVVAVPCKCMGKCSMTMNVKVHKDDTNPQHHSHVRLEDASLILNHHFGLGRPPSGLPSLPFHDKTMAPSTSSL